MIERKSETITKKLYQIVAIKCDICGTRYTDEMELQEFHHISFTGGYGSVFGDESQIECDVCQHCLFKIIEGKYREWDEGEIK